MKDRVHGFDSLALSYVKNLFISETLLLGIILYFLSLGLEYISIDYVE